MASHSCWGPILALAMGTLRINEAVRAVLTASVSLSSYIVQYLDTEAIFCEHKVCKHAAEV